MTVRAHRTGSDLRVLHVSAASFGAGGVFGGGERYPYELARAMAPLCQVTLVAFGDRPARHRDGDLSVRVLPTRARWKGSDVNPLSEGLLTEVAAADVIHVHQWESVVANQCVVVGRALGKRVFATDHGGSGRNYWRRLRLNRLVTGFLPVSQFGAGFYPELDDRCHVILGGVDTDRFSPDPSVTRDPRALFVGRLLPHKGIDRLIDAVPPTLELEVIGRPYDPAYRDYLHTRAEGRRIEFRARTTDDELVEAYRRARAVILPSVYRPTFGPAQRKPELLGLTLLEAMACGTPVVCTDVGGMPEIVGLGGGFVIDPDEPAALVAALESLVHDDRLWASTSEAALATARSHTWRAVAERCLSLYDGRPVVEPEAVASTGAG